MAAPQSKPIPLRPSDAEAEGRVVRHDFDDRRRMNVSEKLAEGRGFWRGAFVGASIGAVAGMAGSVGVADMWTKQVLATVQQSAAISSVFNHTQDVQGIHSDAPAMAAEPTPSTPPAGTGSAR